MRQYALKKDGELVHGSVYDSAEECWAHLIPIPIKFGGPSGYSVVPVEVREIE